MRERQTLMFRTTSILIAAAAVLGLAACGSDSDTSASPTSAAPTTPSTPADTSALIGRQWVVSSFITVGPLDEVPASVGASLEFGEDGTVAIRTGCNTGSAKVTFTDDRFTIANIERTEMACEDDRMAIEDRIFALLQGESSWSADGDTLTILPTAIDDAGMILTDVETVPADTSALVDRTWSLSGFITVGGLDEPTAAATPTLQFTDDGTVLVDTGCNTGSASVTFDGEQLEFGPVALTKKACADDVMTLETRVLALLGEPSYWSVDNAELTIYPATVTDTGMVLTDLAGLSTTGETPATFETNS